MVGVVDGARQADMNKWKISENIILQPRYVEEHL